MDKEIIDLRERLLAEYFDPTDARIIMSWLIAAEGRSPVVLVGAGFSRNARHRHRKDYARKEEVPLWWDVIRRMATDLRVEPGAYDAPTMAEMYASSFGDAALRDMLRSMLRDDDLLAGEGHLALGRYPFEAVVTTNLLDTLLDKARPTEGDGWTTVTTDSDLSGCGPERKRRPDLIYFHGHRCAPDSWVITRSQYEDLLHKKPVMVTRVRQLLSQHPLLIVGYSLQDPDFHQLYRQVGSDMRDHHPLGLTIQFNVVPEPERRHWDRLGIRIAIPKEKRSSEGGSEDLRKKLLQDPGAANDFFDWLFKQLETSYSPDMAAVLEHVKAGKTPAQVFERFRGVLPHAKRDDNEGYFEKQDNDFKAWKSVLFSFLTEEEKKHAEENARKITQAKFDASFGRRAQEVATGEQKPGPSPGSQAANESRREELPRFTRLPEWANDQDRLTWQLHIVLDKLRPFWAQVAKHLSFALDRDLFRTQAAEWGFLPWIPLTFWLGKETLEHQSEELFTLYSSCISKARKYGDTHWVEIIEKEAAATNPKLAQRLSRTEDTAEIDQKSLEELGFQALLDGDPKKAHLPYRDAADLARSRDLPFEEWAWRNGERTALSQLSSRFNFDDTIKEEDRKTYEALLDACDARVRELDKKDVVRDWQSRANERTKEALENALERRASAARYRASGGTGFSSSNTPHLAWRSFRDLELIHAPPHMQERYLAPILWHPGFLPEAKLHYRMIFDVKGTKDWLEQLLDEPVAGPGEQQERDAKLVDAFWQATEEGKSKSERIGQLLAFPALKKAFRTSDIPKLFTWLEATHGELTPEVVTYGSRRFLHDEFPRALRVAGQYADVKVGRALFEQWSKNGRNLEQDDLARALDDLPWHRWAFQEPGEVAHWLKVVLDWAFSKPESTAPAESATVSLPEAGLKELMVAFTLQKMVTHLKERSPSLLDDALRARLSRFAEALRQAPVRQGYYWEARRGGYWLERTLAAERLAAPEDLVDRWSMGSAPPETERDHAQELRWSLLADALDDGGAAAGGKPAPAPLVERLLSSWEEIADEQRWEGTFNHYNLNPFQATPLLRFLTTCLVCLEAQRSVIAQRLLQALGTMPRGLPLTAAAFAPEIWGAAWDTFVDRVMNSAGGSGGVRAGSRYDDPSGSATSHQLAAIDLLAELNRRDRRGSIAANDAVRVVRDRLVSAALLGLSDERTMIANHAAFAVMGRAEVTEDAIEASLLAQALRRITGDTRVTVRMAAAYAGGRLRRLARSPQVRQAAEFAYDELKSDKNAMVATQLTLGELESAADEAQQPDEGPPSPP